MYRDTPSAPEFDALPPPYSEIADPHVNYTTHPHQNSHQHQRFYESQSTVQTQIVTQQPATTVHIVAAVPIFFGSKPIPIVCPHCHRAGNTRIVPNKTTRMHVCAVILCLIGFWPCVPLAYCTNFCKDIHHFCPHCAAYQGKYDY